MAAKASSPGDHRAREEYFLTLTKRYTADATEHATTANTYRGTKIAQAAVHCDHLVSCPGTLGKHRRCRDAQAARRCRSVTVDISVRPGAFAGPTEIASSTVTS
jgi:hypothetical protein